jgi:hypothetical protein
VILSPTQRKSCERALALAVAEDERIAYLEKLASVSPQMAERVKQLRERQKWVTEFCQTALSADDAMFRVAK